MKKDRLASVAAASAQEVKRLRTAATRLSWMRLAVCICAAGFFLAGTLTGSPAFYGVSGGALAGFCVLVFLHRSRERQLRCAEARASIAADDLERAEDAAELTHFAVPTDNPEAYVQGTDLDLFGRRSLYSFLCPDGTYYGRRRLQEKLCNQTPDPAVIRAQQEAARELEGMPDCTETIRMLVRMMQTSRAGRDAGSAQDITRTCADVQPRTKADIVLCGLSWCLPILTVVCLILGAAVHLRFAAVGAALMLLQFLIGGLSRSYIHARLGALPAFCAQIEPYCSLVQCLSQTTFRCEYLRRQTACIRDFAALQALRRLHTVAEAVRVRCNPLGYMLCSSLLMWDFHCVEMFRRWKQRNGSHVSEWLECVGEIESIISLLTLRRVREKAVYPTVTDAARPEFSCANLMHPLIPADRVVGNDFTLVGHACVITGSNMSGKTTFLRTVGVSLALLYAGGPVCADAMTASAMRILTSMRLTDSVQDGISSFYAEVLRIRDIIRCLDDARPMLVLIDEIFRGTNSGDRVIGARAVVRRLAAPFAAVLVTTHDFELCDLERDSVHARNCHFQEHYEGDRLCFDYKIHEGRCTTTNARHLLRLAGITDDAADAGGQYEISTPANTFS